MAQYRTWLLAAALPALALALSSCADPDATPETAPDAAPESGSAVEADAPAEAATPAADEDEGEGLNALEIAARETCAAGDSGFGDQLPTDTSFASRGPDGRVHIAWNDRGEVFETIIPVVDLETEDRMAFEGAVADFIRHNLVAGFDRTGLTGAFRYRDGRFCVVQTEEAVIAALQDAVDTAQSALTQP